MGEGPKPLPHNKEKRERSLNPLKRGTLFSSLFLCHFRSRDFQPSPHSHVRSTKSLRNHREIKKRAKN